MGKIVIAFNETGRPDDGIGKPMYTNRLIEEGIISRHIVLNAFLEHFYGRLELEPEIRRRVQKYSNVSSENVFFTDSDIVFDIFRVLVKEGVLTSDQVQIVVLRKDGELELPNIDKDGRLDYWPDLLDVRGDLLDRLL